MEGARTMTMTTEQKLLFVVILSEKNLWRR